MPETAVRQASRANPAFRRAQWRVLLATMFCYLFYYTGRQSFGFAIPGIESELGLSKMQLGWVSSALLWTYALGQVVNGNLGDRFGGRRMMSAGAVLSCAVNWLLSVVQGFGALFTIWGLNGFVQSMGWAPGSRVLSNWWSAEERGRVYGAYVFAAGMSSVLAFATSSLILSLDLGWRWIFRLPVLLMLVGGSLYYVLVRDRPEEEGYTMPDDSEPAARNVDAFNANADDEADRSPAEENMLARYRAVLANRRFVLSSVAIGFQSMARYGLLIWVPVHLLGSNWKEDVYGKWVSLALPLGMAAGALASGWLSDRAFGGQRSRLITIMMAAAGVMTLLMYGEAGHPAVSVPLLFMCGFFAYGPQAAFWALCTDLLGRRYAGTGTGIMDAFAYIFAGLGEPLIGWVIQSNGQRTDLVFVVISTSCFLSAVLALGVRR